MKKLFVLIVLLLALIPVLTTPHGWPLRVANAQYSPMPNESSGSGCPGDITQCGGYKTLKDIDVRFDGTGTSGTPVPISPLFVSLPFASLGTETDGLLKYCSDCVKANPCVGGGGGAWAFGQNGAWSCNATNTLTPSAGAQILVSQSSSAYNFEPVGGDLSMDDFGNFTVHKVGGVNVSAITTAAVPLSYTLGGTGTNFGPEWLAATLANSSTGTVFNKLFRMTSAGTAQITNGTTDVDAYGIAFSGAGTTGNMWGFTAGFAVSCIFDGASSIGDYVVISNTVDESLGTSVTPVSGDCHDAGSTYPVSGAQILGRVFTSVSGAGQTGSILLYPGEMRGGGVGGPITSSQLITALTTPPPIGGTTPNTGAFTGLTSSSLTVTGFGSGCLQSASGVVSSTGTACGSGGGTIPNGAPPQMMGYSGTNTGEAETVTGDLTFTRTGANAYHAAVSGVGGSLPVMSIVNSGTVTGSDSSGAWTLNTAGPYASGNLTQYSILLGNGSGAIDAMSLNSSSTPYVVAEHNSGPPAFYGLGDLAVFSNDTNITASSSAGSNTIVFAWANYLAENRGGMGADMTAVVGGAIPISQTSGVYTPEVPGGDCTIDSAANFTCAGAKLEQVVMFNDTVTGTSNNKLAKPIAPSSCVHGCTAIAQITTTADTTGILGVVVSGGGTSGQATIQVAGSVQCFFDNSFTIGHYAVASTTSAGDCSDAGATYPRGVQVIGRITQTHYISFLGSMIMLPPDQEPANLTFSAPLQNTGTALNPVVAFTGVLSAPLGGTGSTLGPAYVVLPVPNAASTATETVTSKLVSIAPSGSFITAVMTTTSALGGAIGICGPGGTCGVTGTANVVQSGIAGCFFDGTAVVGDFVQISNTTTCGSQCLAANANTCCTGVGTGTPIAGDCHDSGSTYPSTGGMVFGRVATATTGPGFNTMVINFPIQ